MAALALGVAACGDDNGGGPDNQDPVAAFTFNCNALVCTFTDGSDDPDGVDDLASWSWDFGGDGESDEQSPVHTFSAANTYEVTLTVTDAAGATNSLSQDVVVSTTANVVPTADFDFICNAEECTFTDASSDTDGTIASYAWEFGDGETSTEADPVHTYAGITELTEFEVTLTVTDDDGGVSTPFTQTVAVAPPAQTVCDNGSGTFVECGLTLTNAATVRVTITSLDCTAEGNTLVITAPDPDETVFDDGCSQTAGDFFDLNGGAAYTAGTELRAQMISGSDDPNRIAPQLRVTGAYPEWLLEFDDGEDPTGPGEPDFNDIVMTVTATE